LDASLDQNIALKDAPSLYGHQKPPCTLHFIIGAHAERMEGREEDRFDPFAKSSANDQRRRIAVNASSSHGAT
jgi:hypothetical protein